MTYCVAVLANDGLVFCADSRTNAGPDMLSSHSKMHVFRPNENSVFCILSAGNLATTQAIINRIESDIADANKPSLSSCNKMVEAARYVAEVNRDEQALAHKAAGDSGIDVSASLILGGQVKGSEHGIYLIYSAGNFIAASKETTHLQIGESKYGKPILDRILTIDISLEDAARCAIVSMDSTIKSNATVGPPIEILIYEKDSLETDHYIKMEEDHDYLRAIKTSWDSELIKAFASLPRFDWEARTPKSEDAARSATLQQAAGQSKQSCFQHPVQPNDIPPNNGPKQSS